MSEKRYVEDVLKELKDPSVLEQTPSRGEPWKLDQLVRELEGTFLHTGGRSILMTFWRDRIAENPVMNYQHRLAAEALFTIAQVNCLRREPSYDFADVDYKLQSVGDMAKELSTEDPRHWRLLELQSYHGAIHAENQDRYEEAARMLELSAQIAAKNRQFETSAINHFRALQAQAYAVLCVGNKAQLKQLSRTFGYQAYERLCSTLTSTPQEAGLWYEYNPLVAITIVYFLANITPSRPFKKAIMSGLRHFQEAHPNLAEEQKFGLAVAMAINFIWTGDKEAAKKEALKVTLYASRPKPTPEYLGLATGIYHWLSSGSRSELMRTAAMVEGIPKYLRAVAEREAS